jgi:transglutaminase-like putative cysteine protease
MNLALLHRRLVALMALGSLLTFVAGADVNATPVALAGAGLVLSLFWQPSRVTSTRMERIWMPVAVFLVVRALFHVLVIGGEVVLPVVDLLLLLMAVEALRHLEARNEFRLYALAFALVLAATAYRPGVLFVVGFVCYVVSASTSLMLGQLRKGDTVRRGRPWLGPGLHRLGAVVSAVILCTGVLFFFAFPRTSRGWASAVAPPPIAIAGFADQVALGAHGSRILPNPQVILRIEFPEEQPEDMESLYWRGRSYDRFDGMRWSRSMLPPSSVPREWYRDRWPGPVLRQEVLAVPVEGRALFAIHPLVRLEGGPGTHPLPDNSGDFVYWGRAAPSYSAWSKPRRPSPEALRSATGNFTPSRQSFLQLPALPRRIRTLADSLTAPHENDYDRVAVVERWFHREFQYTSNLPAIPEEATLDHFLFERRAGHCEYFSTAMVMVLRLAGIPAREVNGFVGGEWNEFGSYLAVTQNQAHSWVEVWFPGYGWVPFDPTPPGIGARGGVSSRAGPMWFFLDGVHHRWSKWVLDYGFEDQWTLVRTIRDGLRGSDPPPSGAGGAEEGGVPLHPQWWWALVLVLPIVALHLLRRTSMPRLGWESRIYARLRDHYARAGLKNERPLGPLAFLERVQTSGYPGRPFAGTVVQLYLRARFAGERLEAAERRAMRDALVEARRALRRE